MSNVLALKFSNAEPDQLLGTLSVEEVMEVLKERVRSEVEEEVRGDYQGQIDDLECQLDEEGDWRSDAETAMCLPQVAIFAAGHRKSKDIVTARG